jgi:hypothetical protein
MSSAKTNAQYDWDDFDVQSYFRQNYTNLIWEDRVLARQTIAALLELDIAFESLTVGIDTCNGGVLRGPSLLAPFIRPDGSILWSDIGEPQLAHIEQIIETGKRGQLGIWEDHQHHMAACHAAWTNAGFRACQLGKAIKQSIFDLPSQTYDIGITCFGPESLTEDRQEWEQAILAFIQSIKPGQPVVMLYMVNSHGYNSPGLPFPATPIGQQDMLAITADTLTNVQTFFVPDATQTARLEGEFLPYDGMAGIVGKTTRSSC